MSDYSYKIKRLLYFVTDEFTKISVKQNVCFLVFQTWDLETMSEKYMKKGQFSVKLNYNKRMIAATQMNA